MFLKEMLDTHNFEGVVRETAAKIRRMDKNTRQDVYSAAVAHLDFVKFSELWDALQSNPDPSRTFRLRELRRQDRPLTIYLCLPPDMIPRYGRWFRLIISCITQFIEYSEFDSSRDHPILMMNNAPLQFSFISSAQREEAPKHLA